MQFFRGEDGRKQRFGESRSTAMPLEGYSLRQKYLSEGHGLFKGVFPVWADHVVPSLVSSLCFQFLCEFKAEQIRHAFLRSFFSHTRYDGEKRP